MSFAIFPPEINSGLIYAGPGAASMDAAAAAWSGLAEDLTATAGSIDNVVSGLTGSWEGPTGARAAAAFTPYVGWLHTTAAQVAQLGVQSEAQARAYDLAHAAVAPPAAIAANRAQLLVLLATNFFGQNAAAIAANETQYMGYWAQSAAAMDAYLAAMQTNLTTTQFNPAPTVAQQAAPQPMSAEAVGQTATPPAMDPPTLSNPYAQGSLANMLYGLGMQGADVQPLVSPLGTVEVAAINSAMNSASIPARFATTPLSMLMQLSRMGSMAGMTGANAAGLAGSSSSSLMESIGTFVEGKLQGAVGTLAGHFTSATQAISAKLSQAASLGSLRVPEAWSSAAGSALTRSVPVLPNAVVSAPTMGASGFPGGGFGQAMMGALSGRGLGGLAAKAPKIVPKPSAGG